MPEYFEDVSVGDGSVVGEYELTEDELLTFAEKYDPQPIHVDPDAARDSMFGGLVASGWHTGSATMRVLVDGYFPSTRALGAIGADELRFPKPVRPGDVLTVAVEIVDREPWDDERGLVHCSIQTTNQDDETVLRMVALILWERR